MKDTVHYYCLFLFSWFTGPCHPNPCHNRGMCEISETYRGDTFIGYVCKCPPGFSGVHCQRSKWAVFLLFWNVETLYHRDLHIIYFRSTKACKASIHQDFLGKAEWSVTGLLFKVGDIFLLWQQWLFSSKRKIGAYLQLPNKGLCQRTFAVREIYKHVRSGTSLSQPMHLILLKHFAEAF